MAVKKGGWPTCSELFSIPEQVSEVPGWESLKCDGWITTKNIPIDDFLPPDDCYIPAWFTQCISLKTLWLPGNESMSLPNFSNLSQLGSLRFQDLSLAKLPDWVDQLSTLTSLLAYIEDQTIETNWEH